MEKTKKKPSVLLRVVLVLLSFVCVFLAGRCIPMVIDRLEARNVPVLDPADYDLSGSCGETVGWGFDEETKTLTIMGVGRMDDYTRFYGVEEDRFYATTPWADLPVAAVKLVGVSNVGSCAFYGLKELTDVQMGKNVTELGEFAFTRCEALTQLTIPGAVTDIADNVFRGCTGLEHLDVDRANESFEDLDGILFTKGLEKVVLHPAGKTAGDYVLPEQTTQIGAYAFESTDLTCLTAGDGLQQVDTFAFASCVKLTHVQLPDSAQVAEDAFVGCVSLEK